MKQKKNSNLAYKIIAALKELSYVCIELEGEERLNVQIQLDILQTELNQLNKEQVNENEHKTQIL
jgi:hypothetical protein